MYKQETKISYGAISNKNYLVQKPVKSESDTLMRLHNTSLNQSIENSDEVSNKLQAQYGLLYLQRTVGNQSLGQLIQARLKIGQSNDKYEQEADRVAEQVMSMPDPRIQRAPT